MDAIKYIFKKNKEIEDILVNTCVEEEYFKKPIRELLSFYSSDTKLFKFLTRKSKESEYEENIFHNLCFFGCINTIQECLKNLNDKEKQALIVSTDNENSTSIMYTISGISTYYSMTKIDDHIKILSILYENNHESLEIRNRKNESPLELCFRQTLVGNYIDLPIVKISDDDVSEKEKIQSLSEQVKLFINNNIKALIKLLLFCDNRKLDSLKESFSNIFNDYSYLNFMATLNTSEERRKKISELEHNLLLELENNDDIYFESILKEIDEIKQYRELESKEAEKKLLEELEVEPKKINKPKSKKKKNIEKEKKSYELRSSSVVDIESLTVDIPKYEGDIKKYEDVDLLKKKKLKGVITITCFSKRRSTGNEYKEMTLHGLWPNVKQEKKDNDEIYLDDDIVEANEKINYEEFNDDYKNEFNINCFSKSNRNLKINEWRKHGVYANKYNNINEYIKESCDLAIQVILYLIFCQKDNKNYSFENMVHDITKEESPFARFFKKSVDNEYFKEIQFNVCGIKLNESDEKFEWRFYSPYSIKEKSDGRNKPKKRSIRKPKKRSIRKSKRRSIRKSKRRSIRKSKRLTK